MARPIDDFKEYMVGDVLGHIDNITAKRMFGGYGLYFNGSIFAFITADTEVYFKVDSNNQPRYKAWKSHPFIYDGWKDPSRKASTMPYWVVDPEYFDDRDLMTELVHESASISATQKKR